MHKLKLARMHDSFFCKETKLHLYFYNPVGDTPFLSDTIKRAIKSGKILDVTPASAAKPVSEDKVDSFTIGPVDTTIVAGELKVEKSEDEGIALESLSKEELISFIEENGLDVKFNSKTSASKLRELIEATLTKEAK